MIPGLGKIFDANAREIERLSKVVDRANSLEKDVKKLKDKDFAAKTASFRERLSTGRAISTDLLPEAFALVREASIRAIGMRHYDVQLMAATALFEGKVGEQKTGEGKTLSALPALYLHALSGGVHLVTVNDYLARRDAGWMAPVFDLLGMSVGVIIQENNSLLYDSKFLDKSHGDPRLYHLKPVNRKTTYEADIVYGTNNEFGFDYLRDNMAQSLDDVVQRGHHFAIVDEVDSVLIDEARTPLIISAPDTEPTQKYYEFSRLIEKLSPDTDFKIDEKTKSAHLTEHGITKVEKLLGTDNLYEKDFDTIHHIENALRARTLFLKDRDYVVRDGQVIIVDEFTGRLMVGRRWSDGIHQAVEAKENLRIQQESKTLATITFQNYFRMYGVLSGMTGTASTEAEEFHKIYNLEVVSIPTHRPLIRRDNPDSIYKTLRAKYSAVVNEIEEMYKLGRPVLVGTTSIEKNEIISEFLKRRKILHQVLNAKQHEKEAMIITDAGRRGAVTVATNMAGRGVDIILGGAPPEDQKSKVKSQKWQKDHDEIVKLGGLHVIGTERHEARRIDNQLRGRAGRQGDPGSSRFYLSLEDDLMRIFGGEQISSLMTRLAIPEDQPIENRLISKAIEQAQVKVEGFHFDARKRVVEYDDVINQQREIIYKERREILEGKNVKEELQDKIFGQIDSISSLGSDGDYEAVLTSFLDIVPFDDHSQKALLEEIKKQGGSESIAKLLKDVAKDIYSRREGQVGEDVMRQIERFSYLSSIDKLWMEHIDAMDDLREGVGLRGGNEQERLAIYKVDSYSMFERLMAEIDNEVTRRLFRVQVAAPRPVVPPQMISKLVSSEIKTNSDTTDNIGLKEVNSNKDDQDVIATRQLAGKQSRSLGRNDPCWCGSGKKYKKCHINRVPQTSEEKLAFDLYMNNHEEWKRRFNK